MLRYYPRVRSDEEEEEDAYDNIKGYGMTSVEEDFFFFFSNLASPSRKKTGQDLKTSTAQPLRISGTSASQICSTHVTKLNPGGGQHEPLFKFHNSSAILDIEKGDGHLFVP